MFALLIAAPFALFTTVPFSVPVEDVVVVFFVVVGLVVVTAVVETLHPYDLLKIGATKLMFIPFCSDKFTWKSVEKKDEKTE
ncbi:MAG: hypothetical protein UHL70_03100 [Acutalibacteraceae bacterium]|nr:hypothetical protein [Acutalibacteraceae bacterium]